MAVNLSPAALLDTELPNVIVGMLSLYDIPAGHITLEVTEGSMIKDPDLGHNLSMQVVAERVENKETAVKLRDLGCDILQGHYFANPLDHETFINWLSKRQRSK